MKGVVSRIGTAVAAAMVLGGACCAGVNIVSEDYSGNWEPDMSSQGAHRAMSLEQKFPGLAGITVSGLRDARTRRSYTGREITSTKTQLHLQTDPARRGAMRFDRSSTDYGTGMVITTQSLGFSAKPSSALSLSMNLTSLSRKGSLRTGRSFGASWALGKRLNFSGTSSSTDLNGRFAGKNTTYVLAGSLPDLLGIAKKIRFNVNSTAGQRTAAAVRFESALLGGNVTVESAGRGGIGWSGLYGSVVDFATRFGPGGKVRLDLLTKRRGRDTGAATVVRTGALSFPLGPRSSVAAKVYSNRDTPFGTIDPVRGVEVNATTGLRKWSVGANYRNDANTFLDKRHIVRGLSVSGKASNGATVQVKCSADSWPGATTCFYTLRYDRQVSEEQFVTLTAELRAVNDAAPGTQKSVQVWLDARRRVW